MLFAYSPRSLIASRADIQSCPASKVFNDQESKKVSAYLLEITSYSEPFVYGEKEVSAVVGPIACDGCEIECKDAYLLLTSEQQEFMQDKGVKITGSPVFIRLLEEGKSSNSTDTQPKYDRSEDAATATRNFGWDAKCATEITNDVIALVGSAVVSVGPEGDVALHQNGFQPELPLNCNPNTAPHTEQTPFHYNAEGQGRFF